MPCQSFSSTIGLVVISSSRQACYSCIEAQASGQPTKAWMRFLFVIRSLMRKSRLQSILLTWIEVNITPRICRIDHDKPVSYLGDRFIPRHIDPKATLHDPLVFFEIKVEVFMDRDPHYL